MNKTHSQLNERVIAFIHHLRENGLNIGIKELTDSMQLVSEFKHPDETLTRRYLRALCCQNKTQWQQFDTLFNRFWYSETAVMDLNDKAQTPDSNANKKQTGSVSGLSGATSNPFETITSSNNTGGGKQNTISKADFRFLNDHHAMREAENLAEKLALRLKARTRLKRKISPTGTRIELRHTIRRSMPYGGTPLHPVFSIKHKKPPHLVILHDVSHSMSWNNPLLFRFARGLIKACPDSDAFVFHTRLFCVTELYREKSIQQMRAKLESNNTLWLGGTCIANSLDYFNSRYAKETLHRDSIVIIISDGFDTDSPEYLSQQLNLIKAKTKQVLWLNPMLNRKYDADSETITAAKPFVDQFAPAHSVDALRDVIYSMKL